MPPKEFEEDWDLLRTMPLKVIVPRSTDFVAQLDLAQAKTEFDLRLLSKNFLNEALTPELFKKVVATSITKFVDHWRSGLRDLGVLGLIEVILEDPTVQLDECSRLLEAIPLCILQRLLDQVNGAFKGVLVIVAIEVLRRSGILSSYTLGREDGRLFVDTQDKRGVVRVFTDEYFKL